jgi:ribosomal protein S18 acetylase RimI-like enzyme
MAKVGAQADKRRWKKAADQDVLKTESFLKTREPYCVAACSKFLQRKPRHDHVWNLTLPGGSVSAVIIHTGRSLYPVFAGSFAEGSANVERIPLPRFLTRFLGRVPIHAVQGLSKDADILEDAISRLGYAAVERRSYDLMSLESGLKALGLNGRARLPHDFTLREAGYEDTESLFPLQAGYDQEEVLPRGAVFNPVSCRLNLSHLLGREQALAAYIGGRAVGKINTNAASFTRVQIGGVYVLPEYRGRGIARYMIAAFVERLSAAGKKITLFVKKENSAAQAVYRTLGFTALEDYRISYF